MKYYGYVKYYIGGGLVMGAQEVSILFSNSQVLNSFKIKSPKKIRRGKKKKNLPERIVCDNGAKNSA